MPHEVVVNGAKPAPMNSNAHPAVQGLSSPPTTMAGGPAPVSTTVGAPPPVAFKPIEDSQQHVSLFTNPPIQSQPPQQQQQNPPGLSQFSAASTPILPTPVGGASSPPPLPVSTPFGLSQTSSSSSVRKKKKGRGRPKNGEKRSINEVQTPKTTMIITNDEAPDRITNPLLEPFPSKGVADQVYGAELYKTTEITYHRPDTYPLSYLGRILGFDIPIPNDKESFPTPLPDIDSLPLIKDKQNEDIFLKIPKEESKLRYRQINDLGSDRDDHMTLDHIDPVYADLITKGYFPSMLKPANSTVVGKFRAAQREQGETREKVAAMARSILSLDPDWTFDEWKFTRPDQQETATRWTIDGQLVYANPPTQSFGIIASFKGTPKALLKYRFYWYQASKDSRESEVVMYIEGLGQPTTAPVTKPVTPIVENKSNGVIPMEMDTLARTNTTTPASVTASVLESTPMDRPLGDGPPQKLDSSNTDQLHESTGETRQETKEDEEEESTPRKGMQPIELVSMSSLVNDEVILVLFAIALEHTRACAVWYCLWNAPQETMDFTRDCFRMSKLPKGKNKKGEEPLICDVQKCSSKYAFLKMKQLRKEVDLVEEKNEISEERWLVRLPNADDAKASFDSSIQRSLRSPLAGPPCRIFTGATGSGKEVSVGIRATLLDEGNNTATVKLQELKNDDSAVEELKIPEQLDIMRDMEILRCFPLAESSVVPDSEDTNEVLSNLIKKQKELIAMERQLEPRLRSLMSKTITERIDYEKVESREKRESMKQTLEKHKREVSRRKEMDQMLQEQLEEDMNATCSICGDGEVTPDNQILFCEACNVAVHQMCYGIDEVPEGDYYCVACRHFKRDQMNMSIANERNQNPNAPRMLFPELPIRCELCPIKHGAYIRTVTPEVEGEMSVTKWVHMACAKWQGLNFVEMDNPEQVEDITLLKRYFRALDVPCCLCEGKRGAYHKCHFSGCKKMMHVNCARLSGLCEVNYGEDVDGNATENPWTLFCPDHSQLDDDDDDDEGSESASPKKDSGIKPKPIPVEQLILMAKEFPEEPLPPRPLPSIKEFKNLEGKERARALADPNFESEFLEELLSRRVAGARCEVCNSDDTEVSLQRCITCSVLCCTSCNLTNEDDENDNKRTFKCVACKYKDEMKEQEKDFEEPKCTLCSEKGGVLLESFAKPVSKMTFWKQNPKLMEKTLFGQKTFAHYSCAFWSQGVSVSAENNMVDCSDVTMSNGKCYVKEKTRCGLCGLGKGLKTKCHEESCRARGSKSSPYQFHITCARQAGFQVDDDQDDEQFFVSCYIHGDNEYNLRARLEDLIEIEKRRAGKKLGKIDLPMKVNDASRLIHSSILVVRILGWAWRWAELWVEHDSTWEPLLEPGQDEENMTKAQLKIVDSTPESRCYDARRCRLAAFGAALRNRAYDMEEGFDNDSLNCALRAIMHTKSLVGPWKDNEIDFFVDWLARAYRSKSRLLGLGDNKLPVANDGFCVHASDTSPKYDLGSRPLPGKSQVGKDVVFEEVVEPDDFLLPELDEKGNPVVRKEPHTVARRVRSSADSNERLKPKDKESEEPQMKEKPILKSKSGRKVASPSKYDSFTPEKWTGGVAAIAPSVIKKRGAPKTTTTPSKTPRKDKGFPLLETEVRFSALSATGSIRGSRRGRPPKVMALAMVVRIDDEDYNPYTEGSDEKRDGNGSDHETVDNEDVNSSGISSRKKNVTTYAEPSASDGESNESEEYEASGVETDVDETESKPNIPQKTPRKDPALVVKKKVGRPRKIRLEPEPTPELEPKPKRPRGRPRKRPLDNVETDVADPVPKRPRGRPKRTPEESVESDVTEPVVQRARGRPRQTPEPSPKRKRGRPPKQFLKESDNEDSIPLSTLFSSSKSKNESSRKAASKESYKKDLKKKDESTPRRQARRRGKQAATSMLFLPR